MKYLDIEKVVVKIFSIVAKQILFLSQKYAEPDFWFKIISFSCQPEREMTLFQPSF